MTTIQSSNSFATNNADDVFATTNTGAVMYAQASRSEVDSRFTDTDIKQILKNSPGANEDAVKKAVTLPPPNEDDHRTLERNVSINYRFDPNIVGPNGVKLKSAQVTTDQYDKVKSNDVFISYTDKNGSAQSLNLRISNAENSPSDSRSMAVRKKDGSRLSTEELAIFNTLPKARLETELDRRSDFEAAQAKEKAELAAQQARLDKHIDKSKPDHNDFAEVTPNGVMDKNDAQWYYDATGGLLKFPAIHAIDNSPKGRTTSFTLESEPDTKVSVAKPMGPIQFSIRKGEEYERFQFSPDKKLINAKTKAPATEEELKLLNNFLMNGKAQISEHRLR